MAEAIKQYNFSHEDYNSEGVNSRDGSFFLETLKSWEADFHRSFPHCYADHLFGNTSTMKLIHGSMDLDPGQECGIDLIDGKVDMDAHMEMEMHSEMQTIYAMGSMMEGNLEEPLFLVIDHRLPDGVLQLKYMPEKSREEDPEPEPAAPAQEKFIK